MLPGGGQWQMDKGTCLIAGISLDFKNEMMLIRGGLLRPPPAAVRFNPVKAVRRVLSCLALFLAPATAFAVTETNASNGTSGAAFDADISNSDLIEGLQPAAVFTVSANGFVAGNSFTVSDNSFPLSGLTDGRQGSVNDIVGAGSGSTLFANGQLGHELSAVPQLTFTLDTSVNTLGYSLSGITSIAGYNGGYSAELADQKYTVSYSTVAAPTVFISLTSVDFEPFTTGGGNASTEVNLIDLTTAVGVKSLRFTFSVPAAETGIQAGQLIREIDVFGSPTLAVPEPSTWALLGLSFAGLAMLVGRRRLAPGA